MDLASDPNSSESERSMNLELAKMYITAYETMKPNSGNGYRIDISEETISDLLDKELRSFVKKVINMIVIKYRNELRSANNPLYEGSDIYEDLKQLIAKMQEHNLYNFELILQRFYVDIPKSLDRFKIDGPYNFNKIVSEFINDINKCLEEYNLDKIMNIITELNIYPRPSERSNSNNGSLVINGGNVTGHRHMSFEYLS
jgi:hypothetical protein